MGLANIVFISPGKRLLLPSCKSCTPLASSIRTHMEVVVKMLGVNQSQTLSRGCKRTGASDVTCIELLQSPSKAMTAPSGRSQEAVHPVIGVVQLH